MTKRVLIVEDNELNMKLFHDLLDAQGYETLQTREGLQALQLAVFSQHDRPRDHAEDGEAEHDGFFHRPGPLEDIDDIGGNERRKKRRKHEDGGKSCRV